MNTHSPSRHCVCGTLASVLVAALTLVSASSETNTPAAAFETWEKLSVRWNVPLAQLREAAEAGKPDAQYFLAMTEWQAAWDDAWRSRNLWNVMDRTNQARTASMATNNVALQTNWSGVPEHEIRQRAQVGDQGARWYIRRMENERGAERAEASVPWLKKSAAQQYLPAMHELAIRYLEQTGWRIVPPDTGEGLKLLRTAAERGFPASQLRLAEMLLSGEMVPVNVPIAIQLLQQAAGQGLPRAQFALAQQYAVGHGEPRNAGEMPVALFRKAAEAGVTEAQLALAERYRTGLGTTRDYFEAANWFCRAAETDVASQLSVVATTARPLSLGQVWESVAKPDDLNDPEFERALRIFVRAAKLLEADAQMKIGDYYSRPKGIEHSQVRAFFWYDQAATQGAQAAVAKREMLKGAITSEERQLVERWALELHNSPK